VDSKAVTDGDTITVHVVTADHPGSLNVPQEVQRTAADRAEALMTKNYQRADELQKIILDAGFRQVTDSRGGQVLMKKYRIRLRGIDAPETSMPYGREAKEELTMLVQGKRLKISVYGNDRYSRLVGDVDCNGVFVQVRNHIAVCLGPGVLSERSSILKCLGPLVL
jgi:endonuclease YncB( thermonuclease family)